MASPSDQYTFPSNEQLRSLADDIKSWGSALGFQQIGITNIEMEQAETRLLDWLSKQYHGEMAYMERHGTKRSRPQALIPGTLRIISARMDYLPQHYEYAQNLLDKPEMAYISRYALGRDYHKVLRKRLQKLVDRITSSISGYNYRVFSDSAPVLEKAAAEKAGLGWIGKHSNLISQHSGSWFFLGEIYTDLPLPTGQPADNHCGRCQSCIDACPTGAIVAPYQVDARLCISYLTIELKGSIPIELRKNIGNRIYGCDDCQLVCPWNRFASLSDEKDFQIRHKLDHRQLTELFLWNENEFLNITEGSAIRRIGYISWLRNIAVALGNCDTHNDILVALKSRLNHPSDIVQEHVRWALQQHIPEFSV